jgi:hypothetical protein
MMRSARTASVAALLLSAGAGGLSAQVNAPGRSVPQFEIGVYGGGAYTTDWFTTPEVGGEEEGWAPGFSGIFGAVAQYWLTPSLGLRLHGAYAPEQIPQAESYDAPGGLANSYFYDLDLVFRPFSPGQGGLASALYLFFGGGGYTADIADAIFGVDDDDRTVCYPFAPWVANGVCVANTPDYSTTGMGVVGLGADLFPLTRSLGLFAEVAVHGYDSPAHVAPARRGEDKFTFTPRAVLGLKAGFGNILPPPPAPPPPPLPPPPPPPPPAPETPQTQDIQVCVLQNGQLANVTATYNTTRGDTTVNEQPFATVFPVTGEYAANATWFINNTPITFQNRRFVKYGLPRVLGVGEVTGVGEFQGTPVFAEAGQTRPDVVYVLVRPGCEFQPYQTEGKVGAVRGE